MLAVFLTILGHLSYGTTNVLWKNPRNEIGTLPLIIIRSFFCFLIFLMSFFFLIKFNFIPTPIFDFMDLLKTVGMCAVNYFGLFFYLQSLKHAKVANTIGLSKIGLIIGVLVGYFVYNEEISILKISLCVAVIVGVSLIEFSTPKKSSVLSKGLLYIILSKIFWSTAYFYVPFINKLGPTLFCTVLEFTVLTLSIFLFLSHPVKINFKEISVRTRVEIIILIFLGTLGTFCLNFALANMSIILFAIIGLIEPVLGLVISKLYHREKLTVYQQMGIGIGILAAFILALNK